MTTKRLDGKVAVITGANRGIGRGTALCLAEEGADVLVNFRTHRDEAAEVVKEIEALGRRALAWQADVAERGQIEAMIEGTMKHFGRLDIAVANAAWDVKRSVVD